MTRRDRSELFATVAVVVIAGLALAVAHQRNERNLREAAAAIVTPAPTPEPEDVSAATDAQAVTWTTPTAGHVIDIPQPTAHVAIPADTNFDALDADCARKALAALVRPWDYRATGEARGYADERVSAAAAACPPEWSR